MRNSVPWKNPRSSAIEIEQVVTEGSESRTLLLPLSEGEIHYLWHFMQGSIMAPDVRRRLRLAWGMCQRHAWGWLTMECSARESWLHGPAILYEDLMGRAQTISAKTRGPTALRHGLSSKGPCPMCDMGYGPQSSGYPNRHALKQGRSLVKLQSFAAETKAYWRQYVCGLCLGQEDQGTLCRPHLVDALSRGRIANVDVAAQRHLVEYLAEQLADYARSFRWEWHDTETTENKAALIAAIGWCSGWVGLPEVS